MNANILPIIHAAIEKEYIKLFGEELKGREYHLKEGQCYNHGDTPKKLRTFSGLIAPLLWEDNILICPDCYKVLTMKQKTYFKTGEYYRVRCIEITQEILLEMRTGKIIKEAVDVMKEEDLTIIPKSLLEKNMDKARKKSSN